MSANTLSDIEKKKYVVYETEMMLVQQDERYVTKRDGSVELLGEVFDTMEDALGRLNEVVGSWVKPYEVIRTKRGLDTIVYNSAWIEVEEYDEHDEFPIDDPVTIAGFDSLPDSVREAAMRHEREYWEFLDYERDSYAGLNI